MCDATIKCEKARSFFFFFQRMAQTSKYFAHNGKIGENIKISDVSNIYKIQEELCLRDID